MSPSLNSLEQNETLTATGPNTPMGEVYRRYWIPALLSDELPEPDCPPVRVKLLSEQLVAFRTTDGQIGLIDEFCAHRRVSLWFGRNEENGLRCPYHGWKFERDGQCVAIPSEPLGSTVCEKVKLTAYPCIERGGVVWTYMGPAQLQPPPPEFEWMLVPAAQRFVGKRLGECNSLQAMEGGIDSSHVSSLHRGEVPPGAFLLDPRTHFEVADTAGGLQIGASRKAADGQAYWRITQWVMPWYTMIPHSGNTPRTGHAWVPIDDATCFAWNFTHHPDRPLTRSEIEAMQRGEGLYAQLIPGTFRTVANKDNDYLMDRAAQKTGRSYSGIKGIAMQDASLQESMGPVVDRSKERLVASDVAIVQARRRLLAAAESLQAGSQPPGREPASHRVQSAAFLLPAGVTLSDAVDVVIAATRIDTRVGQSHPEEIL